MLSSQQIDHIDQQTKLITIGYIRKLEYELSRKHHNIDSSTLFHLQIPSAITIIIISYIHNYFMYHSSYKWTIDKTNILSQVLTSLNGDRFTSPVFEVGKLDWEIELFPNGDKQKRKGSFIVNLKLLTLPTKWKEILICRTMSFQPLSIKRTTIKL